MAQRILGQGDLMGLVEKVAQVQSEVSQEELEKQQEKLAKGDFTLDDFRKQFAQIQKMGDEGPDRPHARHGRDDPRGRGPRSRAQAHPGHDRLDDEGGAAQPRHHRSEPPPPHRRRAGTEPHEIKQFLGQFDQVRTLMRQMAEHESSGSG